MGVAPGGGSILGEDGSVVGGGRGGRGESGAPVAALVARVGPGLREVSGLSRQQMQSIETEDAIRFLIMTTHKIRTAHIVAPMVPTSSGTMSVESAAELGDMGVGGGRVGGEKGGAGGKKGGP